jgi:hypothetical protein
MISRKCQPIGSRELDRTVVGGSVDRRLANARPPTTAKPTMAATPATGSICVASTVTRIGPTMKIDSSTTASNEYAVCSWPLSSIAWAQRARTQDPIGG